MSEQSGTGGEPQSEPNVKPDEKKEMDRLERMGMRGPPVVVHVAESEMIYHERPPPEEYGPPPPPEPTPPPEEPVDPDAPPEEHA
jgi:hypothetical protein